VVVGGKALGEYLKLRRDRVRPEDVGLVPGPRRRVQGLRREELAALAGISADYYLRIEQGRDANPSPQILDALARALRMDDAATAHLYELARADERPSHADAEHIPDGVGTLVDQLNVPAMVVGRCLDCLASNSLARALSPNFTPGHNLLRQLFLDPSERRLHVDWDDVTAGVVGGLRQVAAAEADPRLDVIVDQLRTESERFRTLWARADVGYRPAGTSHMHHPRVGELQLQRNRFLVPDSGGLHLQIYHALPGTDSAAKLEALRSMS
jgi:transcriptional regulator with XRE-family HTH domain